MRSSLERGHAVPGDGPVAEHAVLARAEEVHAGRENELHGNFNERRAILCKGDDVVDGAPGDDVRLPVGQSKGDDRAGAAGILGIIDLEPPISIEVGTICMIGISKGDGEQRTTNAAQEE